MTARGRGGITIVLLLVSATLLSGAARGADQQRAVAVADFSVRAPGTRAASAAWLGPAVAELLQAKMQLFRGARVLERMRLALPRQGDATDAAAGEGPGAMPDDVLQITPAAVLIFGSVEVSPGDDEPARIKVQARSVETETAAVITDATFSGTAELAGLLRIAESLAKTLADTLGFTYTPEQLIYAEPAVIDALKLHLEGDAYAAAGRHREAIEAYQRALDNNGGKYYPAAHRAQGEAYRALAGSLGADEARRTREEYLAKFKADALVASGALFDLGLAYEVNGLWREAIGAYDDYLAAIGTEGETVQWTFSSVKHTGAQSASVPFPAVSDGSRIHVVVQGTSIKPGFWWVALDAASGAVVGEIPLPEALALKPGEAAQIRLFAADQDTAYVYWHRLHRVASDGIIRGSTWYGDPWVAALDHSGRLLWKVPAGSAEQRIDDALRHDGRLCVLLASKDGQPEGLLLDDANGRTIGRFPLGKGTYDVAADRVVPPYFDPKAPDGAATRQPGVRYPTGRPGITFSVSEGARQSERDRNSRGVIFYEDGKQVLSLPRMQPVFKDPPLEGGDVPLVVYDGVWKYRQVFPKDWRVSEQYLTEPPSEKPTGVPGLTLFGWGAYSRLFKDGRQVLQLTRSDIAGGYFMPPQQGWIVVERGDGVTAVNPANLRELNLYEGARIQRTFLAQDEGHLLFALRNNPARGGIDPRYGTATTEPGTVLNLVSKESGAVVAKHFLREMLHLTLVGRDPVVVSNYAVTRIRFALQGLVIVKPAAEAHLRRAACFAEIGDDAAAVASLARFEADLAGDPRSTFLRMTMAARRGDRTEAGRQGLRAMASGGLSGPELQACLGAVRAVRPEVRDALASKVKSRLLLRSVAAPGVLVATPEGRDENVVHVVVDTVRRTSAVVPTPEFGRTWSLKLRYEGGRVFGLHDPEGRSIEHVTSEMVGQGGGEIDSRHEVSRVDLLSGSRTRGAKFPFSDGAWLPGPRPCIAGRAARRETVFLLDPDLLTEVERLDVAGHQAPPLFAGEVLVLGGGAAVPIYGKAFHNASFLVLDGDEGRIIGTQSVDLDKETVAAVAADRERLVVGLNSDPPGKVRLVSFPLISRGRTWTWRGEGRLAGNFVFEGGRLAFPFEEPRPSDPPPPPGAAPTIVRASLDLETGEQLLTAPLAPNAWAPPAFGREARVRIFPEIETWRLERDSFAGREDVYRVFAPDRVPLRVSGAVGADGCQVVVDDQETTFQQDFVFTSGLDHVIPVIACEDTVYESIGGGVVLVKDFADGVGLERVIRDQRIGLWR